MRPLIRAGLIGAGRIGRMYLDLLQQSFPDVCVAAVGEHRFEEEWRERWQVPNWGRDERIVLDDASIEVVVIAASTPSHASLIEAAARAGKHIFCEKPVAFDPDVIRAAARAAEDAGVLLQIGFNRRFDAGFRRVRRRIAAGDIGEVHAVRVFNRDPVRPPIGFVRSSGGLFLDFTVHDFDMVRFLTGREVESVYAAGAVRTDPAIGAAGDVDTALITLQLAGGALAAIDNSRETHFGYDQRVEVHGSKGALHADNVTPTTVTAGLAGGVDADRPCFSYVERYRDAYVAELRAFFDAVRTRNSPSADDAIAGAEDAAVAVEIALAAARSYREHCPVAVSRGGSA
jgi:myo-inositol 2-dehydrogenase/D-chiro-inositol 1-dehydrogenase